MRWVIENAISRHRFITNHSIVPLLNHPMRPMKFAYIPLLAAALLVACSEPKKEGIEGKKAELAELKKQQSELNAKVAALQTEVTRRIRRPRKPPKLKPW